MTDTLVNTTSAAFLLLEDEEQETLAEALAFVDTFPPLTGAVSNVLLPSDHHLAASDTGALFVDLRLPRPTTQTPSGSSSSGSTSSAESSSGDYDNDNEEELQQKKLRARAANTRAVNRYRKRTKNEILDLRAQMQQLEAQLTTLRGDRHSQTSSAGSHSPKRSLCAAASAARLQHLQAAYAGVSDAMAEYRTLQQSEALNRRLKHALEKQRKLSAALESVFRKQISKTELSFVWDVEKRLAPQTLQKETAASRTYAHLVTGLFHRLHDCVYVNTAATLQVFAGSDVDALVSNTTSSYDALAGRTVEFTANTPLTASLEAIDASLWSLLSFPTSVCDVATPGAGTAALAENESSERTRRESTQQASMTFDGLLAGTLVDGASVIRKFNEPHRVVLAYTSLLTPSGSGLLFRESVWIVVSDAHVAGCSAAPTLLQIVYRLQMDREATQTPLSPELLKVHDHVLTQQSDRLRGYLTMVQNRMQGLDKATADCMMASSCFEVVSCC